MFHHGIAGSQVLYNGGLPSQKSLITEQARQVLNENELGTLDYYLEEYCKGYITISAFALALFDLFNTPSKVCRIQGRADSHIKVTGVIVITFRG